MSWLFQIGDTWLAWYLRLWACSKCCPAVSRHVVTLNEGTASPQGSYESANRARAGELGEREWGSILLVPRAIRGLDRKWTFKTLERKPKLSMSHMLMFWLNEEHTEILDRWTKQNKIKIWKRTISVDPGDESVGDQSPFPPSDLCDPCLAPFWSRWVTGRRIVQRRQILRPSRSLSFCKYGL